MTFRKYVCCVWANFQRIGLLRYRQRRALILAEFILPLIYITMLYILHEVKFYEKWKNYILSEGELVPASIVRPTLARVWFVGHGPMPPSSMHVLGDKMASVIKRRFGATYSVKYRYFDNNRLFQKAIDGLTKANQASKLPHVAFVLKSCIDKGHSGGGPRCPVHVFSEFLDISRGHLGEQVLSSFIITVYSHIMTKEQILNAYTSINVTSISRGCKLTTRGFVSVHVVVLWVLLSFIYHHMILIAILVTDRSRRFDEALWLISKSSWAYAAAWFLMSLTQSLIMALVYSLPTVFAIRRSIHFRIFQYCLGCLFLYASTSLLFFIGICLLTRKVTGVLIFFLLSIIIFLGLTSAVAHVGLEFVLFFTLESFRVCSVMDCDFVAVGFPGVWQDMLYILITQSIVTGVLGFVVVVVFLTRVVIMRSIGGVVIKTRRYRWKRRSVLTNISLSVRKNHTTVVLGQSNDYKAVMLNILMGLCRPNSGHVFIDSSDNEFAVRMCPAYDFLHCRMTVKETLKFFLKTTGLKPAALHFKMQTIVNDLGFTKDMKVFNTLLPLSKRKLLALAILFLHEANVFVLDEPLKDLSNVTLNLAKNAIAWRRGIDTMLITSSQAEDAIELADHLAIMEGAELAVVGSPTFVQKNLGIGARLAIRVHPSCPQDILVLYLRLFVPLMTYVKGMTQSTEQGLKELHFLIPVDSVKQVEFVMANLTEKKTAFEISSIAITQMSLEDVFAKLDNTRVMELMLMQHSHPMKSMSANEVSEALRRKLNLSKTEPIVTFSNIGTQPDLGMMTLEDLSRAGVAPVRNNLLLRRLAGDAAGQGQSIQVPIQRQFGRHFNAAGNTIPEKPKTFWGFSRS